MGRRKRKQPTYRRVRHVPKIFTCPSCGEKSVKVKDLRKSTMATVKCGNCGIEREVLVNAISEPVDAFGDFVDVYYVDQELQRLEKRIEKLKKDNEWGELALSYSILSDVCRAKAAQMLEDENNVNLEEATNWKLKAEQYKKLEKEAVLKLDTDETIKSDIKTEEDSLFAEHADKTKKQKELKDIFDDPGFLEF